MKLNNWFYFCFFALFVGLYSFDTPKWITITYLIAGLLLMLYSVITNKNKK